MWFSMQANDDIGYQSKKWMVSAGTMDQNRKRKLLQEQIKHKNIFKMIDTREVTHNM
jgi:hypothetical protein